MIYVNVFLPKDPEVKANPNARRFISRPYEHKNKFHKTDKITQKSAGPSLPKKSKPSNTIVIDNNSREPTVQQPIIVALNNQGRGESSTAYHQGKNSKKLKMRAIDTFMVKYLSMHDEAKDDIDKWAQSFAMDVILTGCKKLVSQNASLQFYDTVIKGGKCYHETVLGNVQINGRNIAPPPRIETNKNNISAMQKAILDAHILSKSSPNEALRQEYGKYYCIMHDGIQKFSHELNGVFL